MSLLQKIKIRPPEKKNIKSHQKISNEIQHYVIFGVVLFWWNFVNSKLFVIVQKRLFLSKIVAITALLLISSCFVSFSQTDVSLRITTLSVFTTENANNTVFRLNLDKYGYLAIEPGLMCSYDYYVKTFIYSLHVDQALYFDAAGMPAGYTGFGFRARLFKKWKHSLHIGFGTAFHYRKNWNSIAGYKDDNSFTSTGKMQYNLEIITGGLEYNYYFRERADISFGLNECYPGKIMFSAGFRYWISKKVKSHFGCNTCPKF